MPLYEFRCEPCGEFEAWQTLAELGTPIACPSCQAIAKRMFSPPNLSLNSSFSLKRQETRDPQVVNRDRDPKPTHNKTAHGRPWMISH
jgi:putative FmdB family regulatory protein